MKTSLVSVHPREHDECEGRTRAKTSFKACSIEIAALLTLTVCPSPSAVVYPSSVSVLKLSLSSWASCPAPSIVQVWKVVG